MNADAVHLAGETKKALIKIQQKPIESKSEGSSRISSRSMFNSGDELQNTVAYKILCGSHSVVREYFHTPKSLNNITDRLQVNTKSRFLMRRRNWEFHRVLSYWSIVAYIVGCCLFAVSCFLGSAVMLTHIEYPDQESKTEEEERKFAFIMYPFYIGSLLFTFAGYIGWFRSCNSTYSGEKRFIWLWPNMSVCKSKEEKIFIVKSGFYFFGGCFYSLQNLNKMFRGHRMIPGGTYGFQYMTQVVLFLAIASTLQLFGAILELRYLHGKRRRWKDLSWWAVWINLFSCLAFSTGSLSGCVRMNSEAGASQWVNIPFLVGSAGFCIASWMYLIIFKQEQYAFYFDTSRGKFVLTDQFFIVVYIYNLILSLCNFVYALDRRQKKDIFNILFCAFGVWIHIMLLQLTNVICTTPKKKGWGCLHTSLRFSVLLFSIPITLQFLQWYDPVAFNYEG